MYRDQNFTMWIDSHQELRFTVEGISSLAGATVTWKLARTAASEPLIIKSAPADISISGTEFTVHIAPDDNKDLERGTYYHEARLTDADDKTRPIASGVVDMIRTLTSSP